jgi:hypothetical protein
MKTLYKIFHPEIFQGSLENRNYFEGWYFKHVSASGDNAFAVIPGVSLSEDRHAFIQFIDGITGRTFYFRYPLSEFRYSKRKFEIRIGSSLFTPGGIRISAENETTGINGEISYHGLLTLPKSLLMPGIMGWYSYVPAMECNHGVVSADHALSGKIEMNGTGFDFTIGKGYIEKDWGTSFPESWIWLQCNNFDTGNVSVMISVAKIPWRGSFFMGFISFIAVDGKITVLATYNGSEISEVKRLDDKKTRVILRKKELSLEAIITKRGSGVLKAPSSGLMSGIIKESLDSEVAIELKKGNDLVFSGKGIRAGYEETERIFTYFK